MRTHWLIFLTATAFAGSANAQKPKIQWDPEYDFDSMETFAWQSTPETSLEESDPFMHSRIVTAIEYRLSAAGLTQVEDNPAVWVTYHTETENKVRLQSNSFGYGFGGYGLGGWGYYGYGLGGPVSTTTRVIEYEEDTLIVDIWDSDSRQLVFRGAVTKVFSQSPQKAERQIDKAIDKMAKRAERLMAASNDG